MTEERLTWEQIQEKYPDQWVGLIDVEYEPDNDATIVSAVVKVYDKPQDITLMMQIRGEVEVAEYTTPNSDFNVGLVEVVCIQ